MSDHNGHSADHDHAADHGHGTEAAHADHFHETTHDIVHDGNGPSWAIRLTLAVGGVLLLAAALAAWQMQDQFGGRLAVVLPWLIFGALVLGVAAVVESITTAVWVTLLAGFFLLAAAYIVTGRVNVQLDQQSHAAFIVDRFTGEIRICTTAGCRDLAGFGGPSVAVKLPSMARMRQSMEKSVQPVAPEKPVAAPSP
jgi:hypothetical protein